MPTKKKETRKWVPWAIAGVAVVAVVGALLIWNPPFVQNIVGGSETADGGDSKALIARVGSSKMTLEDYKTLLSIYVPPENQGQIDPMEIINAWIEQEIVYQQAKRMGLDKKDTVRMALEQLKFAYELNRKQVLTQAWLAEEAQRITVPDDAVRSYFNAHKDEFLYEVKLSQIVVTDPLLASQIHTQLKQGGDFKKLAQQYTIDPLKGEPSSFLPRGTGMLTLQMEDAIFTLKPGEFTQPFVTPQGTMIFKLVDKRKVRKDVAFEEVSNYIRSMLMNQQAQQIIAAKLDSLRNAAQSEIEIRIENLLY